MVQKFLQPVTLYISYSAFITQWSGHHFIDEAMGPQSDFLKGGF